MKGQDVALLAGVGLAAYFLLGKKTTTEEGGGGSILDQLPTDLSWLSDIIPQNMIPHKSHRRRSCRRRTF